MRGILPGRSGGWAKRESIQSYMEQLRWYDGELQRDVDVLCTCLFTAGATAEWKRKDFDINRKLAAEIAGHVRREAERIAGV